eukprot:TRINITY_DN6722_c0_g1_i1.p2 TRINITY_DN6722_c0_g1~~TRINITY_DN6722_c0_g1_i1.p2  ORF type:complete len:111 (+),score=18.79 TRINITY_DN6722_c0_g1_i1:29-334(+)
MIRRPPRSTHCISSAASDVYKRQGISYEMQTLPEYWHKNYFLGLLFRCAKYPNAAVNMTKRSRWNTLYPCFIGSIIYSATVHPNNTRPVLLLLLHLPVPSF